MLKTSGNLMKFLCRVVNNAFHWCGGTFWVCIWIFEKNSYLYICFRISTKENGNFEKNVKMIAGSLFPLFRGFSLRKLLIIISPVFVNVLGFSAKNYHAFEELFIGSVFKKSFYLSRENFWWRNSGSTNTFSSSFLGLEQKNFRYFILIFRYVNKNCLLCGQGNFLVKFFRFCV